MLESVRAQHQPKGAARAVVDERAKHPVVSEAGLLPDPARPIETSGRGAD